MGSSKGASQLSTSDKSKTMDSSATLQIEKKKTKVLKMAVKEMRKEKNELEKEIGRQQE